MDGSGGVKRPRLLTTGRTGVEAQRQGEIAQLSYEAELALYNSSVESMARRLFVVHGDVDLAFKLAEEFVRGRDRWRQRVHGSRE